MRHDGQRPVPDAKVTAPSRPGTFVGRVAAVGLAITLVGCGGVALNRTFSDYSAVHADLNNRQLLLNLARMSHSHPPHFLQLGLINTTFQFAVNTSGSVGGATTSGRPPGTGDGPVRLLQRVFNWAFSIGGSASEQPTFSLTPLSGPQFAGGFLATVPPSVFFSLLDQGEPIDELMRTVVQSVGYRDPCGNPVTTFNAPSRKDPLPYLKFLGLVALAAELRRQELLNVITLTSVDPVPSPAFATPTIDDTLKAAEKGFMLQPAPPEPGRPTQYVLARPATSTTLKVVRGPKADKVYEEFKPYLLIGPDAPRCDKPGELAFDLKLRSFFEILSWVSIEQLEFDALAGGPGGQAFLESIPPSQRHPVLRFAWDAVTDAVEPAVVSLEYGGRKYAITDRPHERWNRNVFTLLSYIESLVALDPNKLPVQQLINVR
jgi:hypothetical protein